MPSFLQLHEERIEPNREGNSLAAYLVLEQARIAIDRLADDLKDPKQAWDVSFVAAVALLRSVGHVLHKKDCVSDSKVRDFMSSNWPIWNREPIYKDLIDTPRNKLLKEGELRVERHMGISWSGPHEDPEDAADAEITGFLWNSDGTTNALQNLERAWCWWAEKLGQVYRAKNLVT